MKAYIAFSIHGTNAFISANRTFKSSKDFYDYIMLNGMKQVASRRPGADVERDGAKLEWDKLTTKDGDKKRPLRSVVTILSRFKQLENDGWVIDKKAFIDRHYRKKG